MRKYHIKDYIHSGLFVLITYTYSAIVLIACFPVYLAHKMTSYNLYRYTMGNILIQIWNLLGLQIRIIGEFPKYPSMIASKHMHSADAAVFASLKSAYELTFVAKKSLSIFPYLHDFIFVNRDGRDLHFLKALQEEFEVQKRSVLIFPEGTRVLPGESKEYHKSIALIARRLGVDITPVSTNMGYVFDAKKWGGIGFYKRDKIAYIKIHSPVTYDELLFKRYYYQADLIVEQIESVKLNDLNKTLQLMQKLNDNTTREAIVAHLLDKISPIVAHDSYKLPKAEWNLAEVIKLINLQLPDWVEQEIKKQFKADLVRAISALNHINKLTIQTRDSIFISELKGIIETGVQDILLLPKAH